MILENSSFAAALPVLPPWPLAWLEGGSSIQRPARAPMTMEMPPMMMKATRQPWIPSAQMFLKSVCLAMLVPSNVPAIVPMFIVSPIIPKTLPWLASVVTSATMPLAMGRREASIAPFRPLSISMGVRSFTPARITVMRPCSTHPMTMMAFRDMSPRSAMVPQKGAARFPHRACVRLMAARLFSVRPRSLCKAKKTQASSTPSAPSRPPTEQRMRMSRLLGIFTSSSCSSWSSVVAIVAIVDIVTPVSFLGALEPNSPATSQTESTSPATS
mmetsp:Transcript_2961/g.8210  ORF Transcript_2961/g.8210 Transcript_2961/m.8210 type:complete len:271 (-) Transcript_2961:133-945(-)